MFREIMVGMPVLNVLTGVMLVFRTVFLVFGFDSIGYLLGRIPITESTGRIRADRVLWFFIVRHYPTSL
ncbi:hypothetical protein [Halarchaeum sp. P4]|uniref:hypothetical protein n=1 Tax=Halarchaeum sp. P4 TaxID=3421639 RepID=UPI003EBCCA96